MKINIDFKPQPSKNYTIYIDELSTIKLDGKVAIITNPKISNLHINKIKDHIYASEVHVITIPDGEYYKNLKTVENILNQLFELKFNRKSTLVAFGGGVIGDITGFCASIYERGINFIQVPTTLLAQVDASVGGKTGVNNSFGKNLIGSFHQPKAVYCETEFLKTLSIKEFNAGIAEIIKVAVTLDGAFFEWLESADLTKNNDLKKAIQKTLELKAKVIAQDEKEQGVRAVLNYGHTFAHVIEKQTNYRTFLHGEAVSIGMVMANHLAMELGLFSMVENERVCELLQRYNLPLDYNISNSNNFYEAFFLDKKSLDDNILFVLPNHIGHYQLRDDLKKEIVLEVLRKFS